MKTFLKLLLLVLVGLLCLHLLPAVFGLGVGLAAALLAIIVAVLSVIAALIAAGAGLVVLLSPVWMPVLAIVGVIALFKKPAKSI